MAAAEHHVLSRRLAQRIVDQVSTALEQNVNLMDAQGVIVASRDHARIGTVHGGARHVVRTGAMVAIHPGEEDAGTRAGVNLPLTWGEEVIGVVGVTGDPREISAVAHVVRLATQLLVEQAAEQNASEQREAADRGLLAWILSGDDRTPPPYDREIPVPAPWVIAVMWPRTHSTRPTASDVRALGAHDEDALRWAELQGALWVLGPATRRTADRTRQLAMRTDMVGVSSPPCDAVPRLRAHAAALAALAGRRRIIAPTPQTTDDPVRPLDSIPIERVVAQLPVEQCRELAARVAGLRPAHHRTIDALLAASGSIAQAAAAEHTHRNTVVQRLERIGRATGLDGRDTRDLVSLALGVCATRLLAPADGAPETRQRS